MLPIIGAIMALATISTAGVSAYYSVIKPMLVNSEDEKKKIIALAERDKVIKSWINCGTFPGIEGSGIYTARTSLLKELDIYNMDSSFNVIRFTNGASPAINGDRIHNIGLENVVEISVKNIGKSRLICRDVTIYYVKDRIRLVSKVIPKRRIVTVSEEKNIEYEVTKDILSLDFGDYISIYEPEMKDYQVHHISFNFYSKQTVPIAINVLMSNRDYLFLTCSYKNLLTLSFIDDMMLIKGCIKTNGSVSALVEQRDLSINSPLPIQLRQTPHLILEDTAPTHRGLIDISKISITNDSADSIDVDEIGIYYYDTVSKYIKYKILPKSYTTVVSGTSSETDTIQNNLEIFVIKIIARAFDSAKIFIDLYKATDYRRIETCLFDNVIFLTVFSETDVGGLPFSTPTVIQHTISSTCSNSFAMNGYARVNEFELLRQNPTYVSFSNKSIIDIEGNIPHLFGIALSSLEIYSDDEFTFNGFTIYYIDDLSSGIIKKINLSHYLSNSSTKQTTPVTVSNILSCLADIPLNIAKSQIYRIKFSVANSAHKFIRFFLKMKTIDIDYIITSCIGTNTFYLDLTGYSSINIKALCNKHMSSQIYADFKLNDNKFYSVFDPSSPMVLSWGAYPTRNLTGSLLVDTEPGNIRNPVRGLHIITISSTVSTLTNKYVGIYYKLPSETKIKFKKLDRYVISNLNIKSNKLGSKLSSDGNIIIDNNKFLLCMDDLMGLYDIYEIEVSMNNIDWSQVNIGISNQTGQSYRCYTCMKNNKLNMPIFGKSSDISNIRNLLTCSSVKSGQAFADIKLADIKYNIDPYYDNCLPLTLTYSNALMLPSAITVKGLVDIHNITNIVNIGDFKIELVGCIMYYTTTTSNTVMQTIPTLLNDKDIPISYGVGNSVKLIPGIQYSLSISEINSPNIIIHRLQIETLNTDISQLEIAIHQSMRDAANALVQDASGNLITKSMLLCTCVKDNVISINFL